MKNKKERIQNEAELEDVDLDSCEEESHCDDSCSCGNDCNCDNENHSESCSCEDECQCNECECGKEDKTNQYLIMAQRLQADFDNYRKHVADQLIAQKEEGKKSVIEVFLPCLDTFKEAKKTIADEKVLEGINMIEDKILTSLSSLKVERIETIGKKFDHNLHEVIAVMKDDTKENDIILDEFQAGYTFDGKVIRYSKVIVNKL